jgi:fatty-acyl-CoA synthase
VRVRCREQLARFKVPERIVAVEAFPIVDRPNGPKVQRVRLREMAEALLRESAGSGIDLHQCARSRPVAG